MDLFGGAPAPPPMGAANGGGVDHEAGLVQQRMFEFLDGHVLDIPRENPDTDSDDEDDQETRFEYREALDTMVSSDLTTLWVNFAHVAAWDPVLADTILQFFYRFQPALNLSIQQFANHYHRNYVTEERGKIRDFYISFFGLPQIDKVRDLRTVKVGQLCSVSGTVTRTSEVRPELIMGAFECEECNMISEVEQQFKYTLPVCCQSNACKNRKNFNLSFDQSKFIDWQKARIQENANEVPAGSMPRTLEVILRHEAVEKAKPGDKCIFSGTLIVVPDVSKLKSRADGPGMRRSGRQRSDGGGEGVTGLKALGVRDLTYRLAFLACSVMPADGSLRDEDTKEDIQAQFSESERHELMLMAQQPNLVSRMRRSVAPTVFGHEDIKLGVLLMLFGGVHKMTSSKSKLRGDINVCIVGDPSTAKSQFLKWVCSFVPRAVYTSGKASSAAGLTASVAKDSETGEFCIEAGALMLADNGICCIDEFDKMDDVDQTAIHEAMEQQTISITKAGIQATLNARTSVLAAANPIHGRYDRSKTLKANLQLSPAIMSRFDLFFVVLDECDASMDRAIAEHIVDVHQKRVAQMLANQDPEEVFGAQAQGIFSMSQLRRYIKFSRTIDPVISAECQPLLVDCYRRLRQGDAVGHNRTAYRITVRQLEALIRLSEALARMHLDTQVRPQYIEWAFRLLRTSIVQVDTADIAFSDLADTSGTRGGTSGSGGGGSGGGGGGGRDVSMSQGDNTNGNNDGDDDSDDNNNNPAANAGSPSSNAEDIAQQQQQQQQPDRANEPKVKRQRAKITFQEYSDTLNRITFYLRDKKQEALTKNVAYKGTQQVDIVRWYLESRDDISSPDELINARFTINQIIKRLIEKDEVLQLVDSSDSESVKSDQGSDDEDDDDDDDEEVPKIERRFLMVHPNYAPGQAIGKARKKKKQKR